MADETLDVALRLTDQQYTQMVNKAHQATQRLGVAQTLLQRNTTGLSAATHGAGGSLGGFAGMANLAIAELDSGIPILQDVVSVLKSLAFVALGATAAITGFAAYAMKSAGDLESLKMGLMTTAGSAEEMEKTLRRLQEVARLPGLGFEEAVRASVRLQAVGMDARLAERTIMAFSNALAAAGGSKEDLNGVMIALTQIASKSQISAEEINQLAERIPQIRQLLKDAFGSANTEEIQKMGLSPQQVILRLIEVAEKLPKAMEGPNTAFENFGDVATRILRDVGTALNSALIPHIKKVSDFLDVMQSKGVFSTLASDVIRSVSGVTAFKDVLQTVSEIGSSAGVSAITDIFRYLGDSTDLGDGLIRGVTLLVAGIRRLPEIITGVVALANSAADRMKNFVNQIIEGINRVMMWLSKGFDIRFHGLKIGSIGGGMEYKPISMIGEESPLKTGPLNKSLQGIAKDAEDLYNRLNGAGLSNEVANDKSKGGFKNPDKFRDPSLPILHEIADSVRTLRDIRDVLLGGGAATAAKFNARNISGWSSSGGGGTGWAKVRQGFDEMIADHVASLGVSGVFKSQGR